MKLQKTNRVELIAAYIEELPYLKKYLGEKGTITDAYMFYSEGEYVTIKFDNPDLVESQYAAKHFRRIDNE